MQRKAPQRVVRASLLAATCVALLFTAATRISGTGGLTLVATSTVVTANENVVGRAVAFGNGGLYYAAQWRPTSPVDDMEALAGKFSAPLTNGAAPTWQRQWPDGDAVFSNAGCLNFSPQGNGPDVFAAVAVAGDGVYFGGDSYRQTADANGCKENKEIVAKFNLDGSAGVADVAGAVALWRQRFATAYGYDGTEMFQSLIASVEGGTTYIYGGGSAQVLGGNGRGIRKYDTNGNTVWEYAAAGQGFEYKALAVRGSTLFAAGQNGASVPQIMRFPTAAATPAAPYTGTTDAPYTTGVYTGLAVLNNTLYAAGYLAGAGEAQAYLLDGWDTTTGTRVIHRVWSSDPTQSNSQQLSGIVAVGSRLFAVGWTRDTDNPGTAHNMGGSTTPLFTDNAAYHGFGDGVIFEVSTADGSLIATTSYGTNDGTDQAFTGATTDGTDLYVIGGERNASAIYRAVVLRYSMSVATALTSVSASGSYGGLATLQATLSSSGAPISGATVSFTLSGNPAGSAVTNAGGLAQVTNVSLAGINAGGYSAAVAATFTATGNFVGSNATGDLTVAKAGAAIAAVVPGASLVAGQPHAPYNGQAHPAVGAATGVLGPADSLGPATITYTDLAANTTSASAPVNGGSYRVNASFAGNANYLAGSNNTVVLTIDAASTSTTLQTWSSLATTGAGPAFGSYGSVEFSDGAGRVIVVSADTSNPFVLSGANGLGGTPSWTSYVAPGHPVQKNAAAAYDPASNTLMMYGGCGGGCSPITNQVWVLTHANGVGGTPAWINRTPAANPAARQAMARGYDPASNRLIVFGGQDGGGSGGSTFPDVWALTNANGTGGTSTWTQLLPDNAPPTGQWGPSSWYDSASNRLIVAGGGAQGSGAPTRAVWALTNANGVSGTPHWINLIPEGAVGSPNGFVLWPAAYDAATNRAMLFETGTSNLWVVTNANGLGGTPAYNHVTLSGGPAALTDNVDLPYDAANHRVAVIPSASQILVLGSADGVGRISPSNAGQSVTFTATVSALPPGTGARTGTVTFNDGANTLGSASLNADGQAIFTTAALSAAGSPHAITSVYNGDANFATSSSSPLLQTVNSVAPPTAAFTATPNPAACSQLVTFDATGSYASAGFTIASYAWNFGDGTTGAGAPAWHAYAAFGTYTATLTVTDNNVPAQTAASTVVVNVNQGNQAPIASVNGPYVVDLGSAVALSGAGSSDPNAACGDSIVSYTWNISGGAIPLTGASPILSAAQVNALGAGTFAVSLTVTDTLGATGTASTTLSIYNNVPTAAFTAAPNPAACRAPISFDGSASQAGRPDRAIAVYAWAFGDGASATGASVAHSYNGYGSYTATLTITDTNAPAKMASLSRVITVNQGNLAPVAAAGGPYTAVLGGTVGFNGAGSADPNAACGDNIVSYSWRIDGGALTPTGPTPGVTAAQITALGAGTHSVLLTVTDTFGATGSSSTTLVIQHAEDGDGIPGNPDAGGNAGIDTLPDVFSSGFDDRLAPGTTGTTFGTIINRAGWNVTMSNLPDPAGVQATISGGGTGPAVLTACAGNQKQVLLDAAGEKADLTCSGATTLGVTARTASPIIDVQEAQPVSFLCGFAGGIFLPIGLRHSVCSTTSYIVAHLSTGNTVSLGSPVTADLANPNPVLVDLLDENGVIVGSLTLDPGDSVDVTFGFDDNTYSTTVQLTLLAGAATGTVSGVTSPLTNQPQMFTVDTTPPTIGAASNVTATATSTSGAIVNYPMPTVTDNVPGNVDVTGNPASGSLFPHGQTTVAITARDTAGNVATRTFTVNVQPGLLSIDVTPHDASRHPGQGGQQFTATGTFSQGPPQTLNSGGSGGSGGGTFGLTSPMWQIQFIPSGNFSACATPQYPAVLVSDNWTSQNFFDRNGSIQEIWSVSTPVVNVQGTINSADVVLNLACTSGAATGTVNAHWTGTRYEGTMSFNGGSSGVSITGWSQKAPMSTARFGVSALTLGGKVYAIGGVGGSCNTTAPCTFGPLTTVESYDPATGAWTTAPSLSIGRESAGAATVGGKAYVIGGHTPGGLATGAVEVLDPLISNAWTTLPQADWMPTARAGFALVTDGTYLYALGGNTQSANGGATDVVERYDPSAPSGSRWTTLAPMPAAGSTSAAGVLNGTIVVVGSDGTNRTDVYDIASNAWHAGAPMPAQRGSMAGAVANGGLWVIGGTSNGSLNYDSWVYYPATPTRFEGWAGVGSMPTARWALGAAVVGDVVYAVGGAGVAQASGDYLGLTTNESLSTPPFDELSTGGGSGSGGGSLTVQWQSTSPLAADIDANGFATPHAPGQTTIIASVGSVSGQTTFTVTNSAPTVEITGNLNGGPTMNGPFSIAEGNQGLQLRANAQDPDNDQLTYAWSILSGTGVLGSQFGSTGSQSLSYTNADGPASATVRVIVTDSFGASTTATATITVNNLPPQVSMPNFGTPTTQLGSSNNFGCASFTDQGVNDAPWSATVDYGDGSGAQPGNLNVPGSCGGPGGPGGPMGALNLAHAYNRTGTFTVTMSMTDKDGGVGTGTMSVTVNKAFPSMNLASSPSNAAYGDSITFTATVTGVGGALAPSGSVTFTIDGNQAAAQIVSLNASGQASISTNTLTATSNGNHSISAVYGGDLNYQTSSRNTNQFISKATPGGTLVSSGSPSTYGQNVTFTVTLTGPAGVGGPTGSVTFSVDGSARPPQTLNASGQASFSINTLNAFGHNISSNYSGDSNFQSRFQSISQSVNKATPAVAVTATPNPSTSGQLVTLKADVTSVLGSPTGNVTFYDGTTQASPSLSSQLFVTIDPSNSAHGTVTFTTSSLSPGAHTITAFYNSFNNNLNGSNGSTAVTVNLPPAPAFSQLSPSPAGACICTPSVDVGTASQFWYAMADVSGQLKVTLVAHPSGQAATVNVKIYDAAGAQVAQMSASYPNGFDLPDVRSSRTVVTTANAIYRVEVSSPTATFGYARYWLKFEGALEVGVNSPTFPAFERGWAEWVLNADSGDSLNVRIFSQGTQQPPTGQSMPETVTYQWIAPDGSRSPAQPQALTATLPPGIDQVIPPPATSTPGIWTLVVNSTGPYRLQKMSGADRGIYLNSRTAGFGTVHVRTVDAHGNPFTGPVTFHVTSNDISEDNDSFTTNEGGFDATDVPVGPTFHLQVEGPFGLTASPAQFDVTLSTCDQELTVTIVIADTTRPSITAPADIAVEATGPDGAIVDPGEAIASDVVSAVTVTRAPAGNQFALGTTDVVWTATDAAGNASTATQHITVVDTTAPSITTPADVTAEATSPNGAFVDAGQATGSDLAGAVTITGPSPAQYPLGTTTVTWTATDQSGNHASATQRIIVVDTTKPTLALPADITVDATSPAGAVVNYTASATDNVNGALPVTCTRASGSTFPIGTTTVSCSAADASGNGINGSFHVLVQAAAAQVSALIARVQGYNLAQGIEKSLGAKLQNVLAALNAAKGGNASSVCGQMGAFINETTAQSGKKLTVAQADQLIAAGQQIRAVIGCQ